MATSGRGRVEHRSLLQLSVTHNYVRNGLYGDLYADWSDSVKERFGRFKVNRDLERLANRITDTRSAFIIGAGMSSLTSRFYDMWGEDKSVSDALTNNPNDVERFVNLFRHGGIEATPKPGIDVMPDLVRGGAVSILLVFNYNCHIEICLNLCKVGYRSVSYCGEELIQQTTVGKPICQILKPHGSSSLMAGPTPVIWPDREPETNFSIFDTFVQQVIKEQVETIVILGWSGNFDPHARPYLDLLMDDSGIEFIHVDLPRKEPKKLATVEWGIVKKRNLIRNLKNGGTDFLLGLAKKIGVTLPCIVCEEPLDKLAKRLSRTEPKVTRARIS